MERIICPFCKMEVTEDEKPTEIKTPVGSTYICYKKICRNKEQHWNKSNVIIPYTKKV